MLHGMLVCIVVVVDYTRQLKVNNLFWTDHGHVCPSPPRAALMQLDIIAPSPSDVKRFECMHECRSADDA